MGRIKKSDFINARDFIASLPADERAAIEARTKVLLVEELTLCDLRKAHTLTQKTLARKLDIGQEHVSRLEQRTDMLLSTLAGYVEAMGGKLRLVAEFPDRGPVVISLADIFEPETPPAKAPPKRRAKREGTATPARRAKAEAGR